MYSSYKNLFKIKWKIYSIGDKPLPRPIPLDALGLFVLLIMPCYYSAGLVCDLLGQNRMALSAVLDGLITYGALQYDPQGRSFFIFAIDFARFVCSSGRKDIAGRHVYRTRTRRLDWSMYDLDSHGGML